MDSTYIVPNVSESEEYKTLMKNKTKILDFFDKAEKELSQLKEAISNNDITNLAFDTIEIKENLECNIIFFYLKMSIINTLPKFLFSYSFNLPTLEESEIEKKNYIKSIDYYLEHIKRIKSYFDDYAKILISKELIGKEFKYIPDIAFSAILENYRKAL